MSSVKHKKVRSSFGAGTQLSLSTADAPHQIPNGSASSRGLGMGSGENPEENRSAIRKILDKIGPRKLWKEYGLYGLGTLLTIDALTVGSVYFYIENVNPNMVQLVSKYDYFQLKEFFGITRPELTSKTTTLVTVVAIYKLLGPVRIGFAVLFTPVVRRLLSGKRMLPKL